MIKIIVIPYKNFKQKIRLTKEYLEHYKVQDLGGVLYMELREDEHERLY